MLLFVALLAFFWSYFLSQVASHLIQEKYNYKFFPYFELFTTTALTSLYYSSNCSASHALLISALSITIYTDSSQMVISRFVSLYLVPTGIICSALGYTPIHPLESIIAASVGYALFWTINKVCYLFIQQDGIGQGDLELMALIGSYTGLLGVWFTLLSGSIIGTIIALALKIYSCKKNSYLPFGTFLSMGAIIFIIMHQTILSAL